MDQLTTTVLHDLDILKSSARSLTLAITNEGPILRTRSQILDKVSATLIPDHDLNTTYMSRAAIINSTGPWEGGNILADIETITTLSTNTNTSTNIPSHAAAAVWTTAFEQMYDIHFNLNDYILNAPWPLLETCNRLCSMRIADPWVSHCETKEYAVVSTYCEELIGGWLEALGEQGRRGAGDAFWDEKDNCGKAKAVGKWFKKVGTVRAAYV